MIRNCVSRTLILLLLVASACKGADSDKLDKGELCAIGQALAVDADSMRKQAVAAYEAAAEDFELARKWQAGELGTEDPSGKFSSSQRRGWQNAYTGVTWCRSAEKVHAQVHRIVRIVDSDELRAISARRDPKDCAQGMSDSLLGYGSNKAEEFLRDVRSVNQLKKRLETDLLAACRAATKR